MSNLQLGLILAMVSIVGCSNMLVIASWGRRIIRKLGER